LFSRLVILKTAHIQQPASINNYLTRQKTRC